MPEHPSDDGLTTAPYRSGFDNHPLPMCRWIGIAEAADLAFLVVHQPADAIFRRVSVDKWSVFVGHRWSLATIRIRLVAD